MTVHRVWIYSSGLQTGKPQASALCVDTILDRDRMFIQSYLTSQEYGNSPFVLGRQFTFALVGGC
jgi:hypothetical protein